MKNFGVFLVFLAIVSFIASGIFAYQSYDKYVNYHNSESYLSRNVNAYVGSDAHNYIINGTRFTGFAVYSAGCGIIGALFLSAGGALIHLATYLENKDEDADEEDDFFSIE